MQITGTKKNPTEAWVMYVILKKPKGKKIISAWRYPGRTPEGEGRLFLWRPWKNWKKKLQ